MSDYEWEERLKNDAEEAAINHIQEPNMGASFKGSFKAGYIARAKKDQKVMHDYISLVTLDTKRMLEDSEEIANLKKDIAFLKEQIANERFVSREMTSRRNKLLSQAKTWMEYGLRIAETESIEIEIEQWFKNYQELSE